MKKVALLTILLLMPMSLAVSPDAHISLYRYYSVLDENETNILYRVSDIVINNGNSTAIGLVLHDNNQQYEKNILYPNEIWKTVYIINLIKSTKRTYEIPPARVEAIDNFSSELISDDIDKNIITVPELGLDDVKIYKSIIDENILNDTLELKIRLRVVNNGNEDLKNFRIDDKYFINGEESKKVIESEVLHYYDKASYKKEWSQEYLSSYKRDEFEDKVKPMPPMLLSGLYGDHIISKYTEPTNLIIPKIYERRKTYNVTKPDNILLYGFDEYIENHDIGKYVLIMIGFSFLIILVFLGMKKEEPQTIEYELS